MYVCVRVMLFICVLTCLTVKPYNGLSWVKVMFSALNIFTVNLFTLLTETYYYFDKGVFVELVYCTCTKLTKMNAQPNCSLGS